MVSRSSGSLHSRPLSRCLAWHYVMHCVMHYVMHCVMHYVLAQQAVEQVLGLVAVTWGIAMVHYVGRYNSAVQQCITTVQYAVHYMGHYNSALTVHYVVHYIVQYIVHYMVHHTVAVEVSR